MLRLSFGFLVVSVCSALAQESPPHAHPVGAELGAGFVVGPKAFGALGYEETLFVPTRDGEVALLRYFNASEFCFPEACGFPDRQAELAAMYGWEADSPRAAAMVATGLSVTTTLWHPRSDVSVDRTRTQSPGIPMELRLSVFPCPWLGLSLTGAGGVNRGHNFVGAFAAVQIGYSSRSSSTPRCY